MKSRKIILLINVSLGILMSTSYVVMTTTGAAGTEMTEEFQSKLKPREQKKPEDLMPDRQGKNDKPTIPDPRLFLRNSTQPRSGGTGLAMGSNPETELEAKLRRMRERMGESKPSETQAPIESKQKENNLTQNKGGAHRPLPTAQATHHKLVGGTGFTTGKLRDHEYYKVELQKLEESTRRIHEMVDRILAEFRKDMKEYYLRTRGAETTTILEEDQTKQLLSSGNLPQKGKNQEVASTSREIPLILPGRGRVTTHDQPQPPQKELLEQASQEDQPEKEQPGEQANTGEMKKGTKKPPPKLRGAGERQSYAKQKTLGTGQGTTKQTKTVMQKPVIITATPIPKSATAVGEKDPVMDMKIKREGAETVKKDLEEQLQDAKSEGYSASIIETLEKQLAYVQKKIEAGVTGGTARSIDSQLAEKEPAQPEGLAVVLGGAFDRYAAVPNNHSEEKEESEEEEEKWQNQEDGEQLKQGADKKKVGVINILSSNITNEQNVEKLEKEIIEIREKLEGKLGIGERPKLEKQLKELEKYLAYYKNRIAEDLKNDKLSKISVGPAFQLNLDKDATFKDSWAARVEAERQRKEKEEGNNDGDSWGE